MWTLLAVSMLLRAMGFAYPFIGYHVADRGHGPEAVGTVLAALGIGWTAGQLGCGWLLDRIGRRATLVATMALASIALAVTAGLHSVAALTVSALLTGLFYDGTRPAIAALMCDLVPDSQQRARFEAWRLGWVANIGALICGSVGMLADTLGVEALFWLNAGACAAVAVAASLLLPPDEVPTNRDRVRGGYRQVFGNVRFLLVWLSGLATLTAFLNMYTAVPLIMSARGLGSDAFSIAFMLNAVAVIVVSPMLARPLGKALAVRARPDLMIITGLWMAGSMALIGIAENLTTFCIALIAMGISESAWFVIAADLVNRIAPRELIGRYQGMWGSAAAFAAVTSPILATLTFTHGGQQLVGASLLVLGAIAALFCLPLLAATRRLPDIKTAGAARRAKMASQPAVSAE